MMRPEGLEPPDGMIRRGKAARLSAASFVALLVAGCAGGATDVEVVAGGGGDRQAVEASKVRLDGRVVDLAASDGTVYLLAEHQTRDRDTDETTLTRIDEDESVTELYVDEQRQTDAKYLDNVAAGSGDNVYVASGQAIYRVGETGLDSVYQPPDDGSEPNITGLAVGVDGEPIWAERFRYGDESDFSYLNRIQRMSDGTVERVAGTDASSDTFDELRAGEAAPPDGVRAEDMPLASAGDYGTLAADGEGNVYAATDERSILRFGPDGEVGVVTGPGESPLPEKPFDDEGPADTFNGDWQVHDLLELADVTASEGRVAAVDGSPSNGPQEATDFRWNATDDIPDDTQGVLDEVGAAYPVDDGYYPGGFAVVIDDGVAATVAGHAAGVALDGDVLYIAGQTGYLSQHEPEIVVVAVDLTAAPDDGS